jgi:hypothetical protein
VRSLFDFLRISNERIISMFKRRFYRSACRGAAAEVRFWHSRALQSRRQTVCLLRQCRRMRAWRRTAAHDPNPTVKVLGPIDCDGAQPTFRSRPVCSNPSRTIPGIKSWAGSPCACRGNV